MATLDLSELRELELIRQILIPLFEKMGFKDVDFHHGGVSEKGKDVAMWEPALTGARVNWAVVVKRGKISAAVTGSDSAGTVSTQVRQSFRQPFSDKVTGEDRAVHRCLIVSSGAIDKDARTTILSAIDQEQVKNVEFFDGSKLEELVNKHCPKLTPFNSCERLMLL
jgi:Restriction endonuclease